MNKVWAAGEIEHDSEFIQWHGFKSYPNAPEIAVVIGGTKGKAFDRVARFGQGWFAPTTDPASLAESLQTLKAACDTHNRDFSEIEITCMWTGQGGQDAVGGFAEAGAHRLLVPMQALGGNAVEGIQALAAEVIV